VNSRLLGLVLKNSQGTFLTTTLCLQVILVHLFDGFLSFLNLAILNIAETKELVITVYRDFAAEDLSELAELDVEVLMSPVCSLESSHKNRGALHIFATWFSSDCMQIVRQGSAHESTLDPRVPVLFDRPLSILDCVEHHKSVVEGFEKGPFDADLAWSDIFLVEVAQIEVSGVSG